MIPSPRRSTPRRRASAPTWSEYADHASLLDRIAAGDVDGARRVMDAHLHAALNQAPAGS
jgi:DNA-binding GntR family transcriptional regulator